MVTENRPDLASRNVWALEQLGEACVRLNKLTEAAILFEHRARHDYTSTHAVAERFLIRARDLRDKTNGPLSVELAGTLQALGDVYLAQGKNDEAEKQYQRSREILETAGLTHDPRLAASLNGLGSVAKNKHGFDDARNLYQQAQAKAGDDGSRSLRASILCNLGSLAASNQDFVKADGFYEQCLALAVDGVSAEDPPPISQFDEIAGYYLRQNRPGDAENLYQKNLQLRRAVFGVGSPEEAWGMFNLALYYGDQNKSEQALELAEKALLTFQTRLGIECSESAAILLSVADMYRKRGDLEKSITSRSTALNIRDKSESLTRAERHPMLVGLATDYKEKKDFSNAIRIYKLVAELWAVDNVSSPNYVTAQRNIIELSVDSKDTQTAKFLFQQMQKDLKAQPLEMKKLYDSYAGALRRNGDARNADKLLRDWESRELQGSQPHR